MRKYQLIFKNTIITLIFSVFALLLEHASVLHPTSGSFPAPHYHAATLGASSHIGVIQSPSSGYGALNRSPLGLNASQLSTMSLNNSHVSNNVNVVANNNTYPTFLESPGGGNNLGGVPRLAPSPMASQPQLQVNGNGNGAGMSGMGAGMPMNAGQQMDVNMLYQKVIELSEVLKENREKTQGIVAGAEELAVSPHMFFHDNELSITQKALLIGFSGRRLILGWFNPIAYLPFHC
jgi:hypothetical protein